MAGFIPGIALVPQVGPNGDYLSGCLLRIYEAGTNTLATAYKDYALSQPHPMPIPGDAMGRLPMFFLDDGLYRVRLSSKDGGAQIFDIASIPTVGPSEAGGGEGVTSQTWEAGDVDWQPRSGTRSGWVRHNGRTIGSATSSATERSNADTGNLFAFLWNNFDNAICPVSSGRGASAAADFAANKTIQTLDLRGFIPAGLDDMGNTAAGRFANVPVISGSVTTAGSKIGAATHTLTADQVAAHTHPVSVTDPGHAHSVGVRLNPSGGDWSGPGGNSFADTAGAISTGGATTGITASATANTGGQAHNNTPLVMLGTWYVRL